MSTKLAKGTGLGPVQYAALDANLFRSFGFPGADEYGNMFQVYRDFEKEVNAVRSVEETRKLTGGSLQTFDEWLSKNKAAVMAVMNPAPAEVKA
jgi:NAD(P)H-dependent FMN reductase